MINRPLERTGNVAMTAFGPYELCRFEEWAFMYVYGGKWQDEICEYANTVKEEEFSRSEPLPTHLGRRLRTAEAQDSGDPCE